MSLLRELLPAPIVDFLPILLLLVAVAVLVPRLLRKLKETGAIEHVVDRVGGDKLRLLQFEREIARLKKRGDLMGAAQLYEDAEWYEEALQLYLEMGEFVAAGQIYEKLERWRPAAEMYLKADDWKRAADLQARAGEPLKAAELLEQRGQKIDAARLYFEGGRFDRAGALYEAVSYFPQAGKAFESVGDFVRAAENYEKQWAATTSFGGAGLIANPSDREARIALAAGQLYEKGGADDRAAQIYHRAGLSRQAAELAARRGRFAEAAEMLLKEEELERAAEMFEKAGQAGRAALLRGEVAFHRGEADRAAREFLKGGDNLRAAELFESVGDLASAARCYEQSDAPLQAANVFLRAGKKAEAAAMFEKARDFEMAARLFADIGEPARASDLFEKAGRFFPAGKLAAELGDGERAIRLLQRVEAASEEYEAATLILSRLFIHKGMASLAADKLKRTIGDRPIGAGTIEHFYVLGLALEKLGRKEDAVETYRKVLAERYGYEDVEQRIARLTQAAPAPEPSVPRARPPAPSPAPAPSLAAASAAPAARESPASSGPAAAAAERAPVELAEELGRGALGQTFKAIDARNGKPLAVKLIRKELLRDRAVVQRFLDEARLARSLDHPSLVRILGLTEIRGEKAVVMDYVEGFDLASFLARTGRLKLRQAIDLLTTLCAALGHAHERKLLHRHLKMANVLIAKGGKLRVSGFGLGALCLAEAEATAGYPAPEILGGADGDERTDIYALGALVFHALSGAPPSPAQAGANGAPPRLRAFRSDAPEALEEILLRCLTREPRARFQSTSEILARALPLKAS